MLNSGPLEARWGSRARSRDRRRSSRDIRTVPAPEPPRRSPRPAGTRYPDRMRTCVRGVGGAWDVAADGRRSFPVVVRPFEPQGRGCGREPGCGRKRGRGCPCPHPRRPFRRLGRAFWCLRRVGRRAGLRRHGRPRTAGGVPRRRGRGLLAGVSGAARRRLRDGSPASSGDAPECPWPAPRGRAPAPGAAHRTPRARTAPTPPPETAGGTPAGTPGGTPGPWPPVLRRRSPASPEPPAVPSLSVPSRILDRHSRSGPAPPRTRSGARAGVREVAP